VAAVLPTALAAFSTARSTSYKSGGDGGGDREQFLKVVELLLSDMKHFKQMVRKSLNLLQGMELMNSGYLFAINKSTGAASTSAETRLVSQHQGSILQSSMLAGSFRINFHPQILHQFLPKNN
jgi:hypothetical protein